MKLMSINNNYKTITLVTFTSAGYEDLTQNLCKSIEENDVNFNLNIFCLDDVSYSHDFGGNSNNILFTQEKIFNMPSNDILRQDEVGFGNLMYKKFQIIHESLKQFEYVIYTDSDIVIKKDFIKKITYNFKYKDIVFQDDKRPSKPNVINLCAGFMLIKSNKKMLKFFNPKSITEDFFNKYKTHDQTYINKSKSKFNYNVLSLKEFPNGPKFYKDSEELDPYMVHFNYVRGEEKIDLMKKYNEWYI